MKINKHIPLALSPQPALLEFPNCFVEALIPAAHQIISA